MILDPNKLLELEDNNNNTLEEANSAIAAAGGSGLLPDDDNGDNKNKPNDNIQEEKLNDLLDNVQDTLF